MEPTFIIFVETSTGEVIEAFTWCRGKEAGIARAEHDSKEFGITPVKIWAEPVKLKESTD